MTNDVAKGHQMGTTLSLWSPHTCTTVSPSFRFSRGNNCSKKNKQTSEPSGHLSPSSPTYSPQNNRRLIDPSFTIRISTSTCPVLDSRALSNGWGLVVPDQYRGGSWSVQAQHSQGMIVCNTKAPEFHHQTYNYIWLMIKSNITAGHPFSLVITDYLEN